MLPTDLSSLKVVDLRSELAKRNLPTKGKKDELVDRLQEAMDLENKEKPDEKTQESVVEKTEEPTVKKTEEASVEKTEEPAVEKPEAPTVEKPEAPTVEKTESPAVEKTEAPIVEKTEAPIVEKPKVMETSTTKESMDTDRNAKRRHSIDSESTQEKRVKIDLQSSALYVKGFVRPLIIRSVQELFGKYGKVKRFWMDSIKTHCYVTYETVEEAKSAFENINGIVFPKDTGKALSVGELTPEQVEQLIEYEQSAAERRLRVDWEASVEKVRSGGSLPSSPSTDNTRKARSIGMGQIAKQLAQAAEPVAAPSRQIEVARPPKERTLEDLFCKTKTLPHLYYLPVSEEEAKIKLSKIQSL